MPFAYHTFLEARLIYLFGYGEADGAELVTAHGAAKRAAADLPPVDWIVDFHAVRVLDLEMDALKELVAQDAAYFLNEEERAHERILLVARHEVDRAIAVLFDKMSGSMAPNIEVVGSLADALAWLGDPVPVETVEAVRAGFRMQYADP